MDLPQSEHAALAMTRLRNIREPSPLSGLKVGIWQQARPIVSARTSAEWERTAISGGAAADYDRFLEKDRAGAAHFAKLLAAAGPHAATFAPTVRSAVDYLEDVPIPGQGLPKYEDERLALLRYPEPPAPVISSFLATIPAQRVPPGYETVALPLSKLLKRWVRVEACAHLNKTSDHDWDCLKHGGSAKPRPHFVAFGESAFCKLPFIDGVGHFPSSLILWERGDDSLYRVMDVTRGFADHKNRERLREVFGARSDKELVSFLLDGVRWKVDAPRQMRFARNVESLKPRVEKIGRSTAKLVKAGLYKCVKLHGEGETIDPDTSAFVAFVPQYQTGIGGQDKADNPDEGRKTGDTSAPHEGDVVTTEENGAPGEPVISFNDMTGPRKVPKDYQGPPLPFPDPEVKSRPRHLYKGAAWILYLAFLLASYAVGIKDDIRWMFWQFYLHPSQRWLAVEYLWLPFTEVDATGEAREVWYFCMIAALVMNMGTRPASKIACRFSEGAQATWREQMRAWVAEKWLPEQPQAVQAVIELRRQRLGPTQADPFYATLYTDDFTKLFATPTLGAVGAHLWRCLTDGMGIWMSSKVGAGTVIDSHGTRLVLNGGFGCLSPDKRARGRKMCTRALTDGITRDELEAHNSFIVHVEDIINLKPGSRAGIWAPLKQPGFGTDIVRLSATDAEGRYLYKNARESYFSVIQQLTARASASFWCAVPDAYEPDPWSHDGRYFFRCSSDSCTDPAPGVAPAVFGFSHGDYWILPLTGPWRRKHINVTEAIGPAGNIFMFGPEYIGCETLLETDNTTAASMILGTAKAEDMVYMRRRLEQDPTFQALLNTLWIEHCAGKLNTITDLGSRSKWGVLMRVAAACGIRLQQRPLTPEFLRFVEDVLANTSDYRPEEGDSTSTARPVDPVPREEYVAAMVRQRNGAPRDGDEVTPSHAVSRGVASMSPRAVRGVVLAGAAPGVAAATGATSLATPYGWVAWLTSATWPGLALAALLAFGCAVCVAIASCRIPSPPPPSLPPSPAGSDDEGDEEAAITPPMEQQGRPQRVSSRLRSRARDGTPGATPPMPAPSRAPSRTPAAPAAHQGTPRQRVIEDERKVQQRYLRSADVESADVGASLANMPGSPDDGGPAPAVTPPIDGRQPVSDAAAASGWSQAEALDHVWHSQQGDDERGEASPGEGPAGPSARTPMSPQPPDDRTARRRAATETANQLANDDSPYAICPGEPDRVREMVLDACKKRDSSVPAGSAKTEAWGFAWMARFGRAHNTPWMRPRRGARINETLETWFVAFAILWLCVMMQPSARTKARGFDKAKPDSALGAVYGWRRVLHACGRYLAPMDSALAVLKAMKSDYIAEYGDLALTAQRGQPLSLAQTAAISAALAEGVAGWLCATNACFTVMVAFLHSSGMRNDEVVALRRSNFTLVIDGAELPATTANLRRMRNGCYVKGKSTCSKCDRHNTFWGSRDMWFRYDDAAANNFASKWVTWELAYPCPVEQRGEWPAFSEKGDNEHMTTRRSAALHKQLTIQALGETLGARVTIHWWRVTLATALFAKGKPPGEIQALVRWKTEEAMRIYARIRPSAYADAVEGAIATDAGPHAGAFDEAEIEIDPRNAIARLEEAVTHLDADAKEAKRKGKAREQPSADPAPEQGSFDVGENADVAASLSDARGLVGNGVSMPDKCWPGETGTGSTRCTVVAFAEDRGKYVLRISRGDWEGQHYLFAYDQIERHLAKALRGKLARQHPQQQPRGKRPRQPGSASADTLRPGNDPN